MYVFGVLCFLVATSFAQINNVCKTYPDYATKAINPNCWYNPDVDAPPSEIINRQGYSFESYSVTTDDGYILSLFRVGKNGQDDDKRGQPIYLQHGIAVSSNIWFDHGNRSVALFLASLGYDVWIANIRGTRYSPNHIKYSIQEQQFWNFSWPEVALYDLPANLKFVNKMTGKKAVYIGHSMGTTVSYVYAIEKNKEAHKLIKGIISLSPVAYLTDVRTPFKVLAPLRDIIKDLAEVLGLYGLFRFPHFQQSLARLTCDNYPFMNICVLVLFLIFGFDYEELQPQDVPLLLSGSPDGFSVYSLVHYAQEIPTNHHFQKYDFGTAGNLREYGTRKPPEYDVKEIDFCIHLFYGDADYLADSKDVQVLHKRLPCSTLNKIASDDSPSYNHVDFVYGKNVKTLLYPKLLKRINQILSASDEIEGEYSSTTTTSDNEENTTLEQ